MLLGFKRRFAPFVEEGSKTHSLRGIRKLAPRVGETCHCYVDPRQKSMRLLGRWPCVKVSQAVIDASRASCRIACSNALLVSRTELVKVTIDGVELSDDEREAFAYRDGFRSPAFEGRYFTEMIEFWSDRLILNPIWNGHLIHWNFSREGRP